MNGKDEIMVSVLCTAYNHEKYIRQCLDGFVMQKTNFKFEVIVHDDASTDKTAEIIREYEKKYPEIIKPIYQTENQYSKKISITPQILLPKSRGKYIAICEGDDFWTDELKLKKQVEALENNSNCCMCVTKVQSIDEDGSLYDKQYPSFNLNSGVILSNDFLKIVCHEYAFQTSCYFLNREKYLEYFSLKLPYTTQAPVGDYPILLYFGSISNVYYINDITSNYRKNSIGSFSDNIHKSDNKRVLDFYINMCLMMEEFDKYTNYTYHKYCDSFEFLKYLYYSYVKEKNYKEILKKKYKKFFRQESFKDRLFIKTTVYFPYIARIYNKIKAKG